jgi:hypothetical protein
MVGTVKQKKNNKNFQANDKQLQGQENSNNLLLDNKKKKVEKSFHGKCQISKQTSE